MKERLWQELARGAFILIDKPIGCTSSWITRNVLRMVSEKVGKKVRAGHHGTLDPACSGLLPVAVGSATKLLRFLNSDKEYAFTVKIGYETDSYDLDGVFVREVDMSHVTLKDVEAEVRRMVGVDIPQIPPLFSAKKVGGRRAHAIARQMRERGGATTIELPPKLVNIHEMRLVGFRPGSQPEADIVMQCGAGTFVRSVARDLGANLGGHAGTVTALRRTVGGGFKVDAAVPFCPNVNLAAATVTMADAMATCIPRAIEISGSEHDTRSWATRKFQHTGNIDDEREHLARVFLGKTFLGVGHHRHDHLRRVAHVVPLEEGFA